MNDEPELNFPSEETKSSSFATDLVTAVPRKVRIIMTIVFVTMLLILILNIFKPQAPKRPIPETVVTVEVMQASRGNYPVTVNTNGTIQADTRGSLVSQIRGEIVKVSDNFKNGGSFNEGDILIEVDQRDYQAEVSQAISAVSQAQATLEQEQALAKQAKIDWQRLGNTGAAPLLVARQPQLTAAKAQLKSAEARYETAQLNLDRTKIKAPYSGRVIQRNTVLGQYVSIGNNLAEIFATDKVEVRLPVSQQEYTQLGLDKLNSAGSQPFKVTLSSQLGTQKYQWEAVVTRTDSTFDIATRQIDVIAEVIDPFSTEGNKPALKIGQFVNAAIEGRTLENVITVPNKSLREGSYVFTSQDGILVRTPISLQWQDDRNAVIQDGINDGDIVVTTSLNSTLAGARVKFDQDGLQLEQEKLSQSSGNGDELTPEPSPISKPDSAEQNISEQETPANDAINENSIQLEQSASDAEQIPQTAPIASPENNLDSVLAPDTTKDAQEASPENLPEGTNDNVQEQVEEQSSSTQEALSSPLSSNTANSQY